MKETEICPQQRTEAPPDNKAQDFSACPYCGQPLIHGKIYGESDRATYWLPVPYDLRDMGLWLTTKKVKNLGGRVLGEASKLAFIQKSRPDSYFCKACNLLITKP